MLRQIFFALLLASLCFSQSIQCEAQWQCLLTVDYNYVACIEGRCTCRSDLGFSGNHTLGNPCICETGKEVVWRNSIPYCIPVQSTPTPPISPPLPLGACSSAEQCFLLTVDLEYIECVNNRCTCAFDRGFEGNATLLNPCTCPLNKRLVTINEVLFCLERPPVSPPISAPAPVPVPVSGVPVPPPRPTCTGQWECTSVTLDYNFVSCINGSCVCRINQGFTGIAINADPCRCPVPKSVIWIPEGVVCVDLALVSAVPPTQTTFLPCNQTYQCQPISTLFQAVQCQNNRCVCQNNLGFTGLGTPESPCRCEAPAQIYWSQNLPFCAHLTIPL